MLMYSAFRKPDSGYSFEMNKFVIPDNYMINVNEWCDKIMPQVVEGIEKWPWEKRVEKGFWRGKLTGMDLDTFPIGTVEHNPSPETIRHKIIENPASWPRIYLTYLSSHNPEYIDAKTTDRFPL